MRRARDSGRTLILFLAAKCCNTVPIFSLAATIIEAAAFSVTAAVGIL
jgi:hypothetical protein